MMPKENTKTKKDDQKKKSGKKKVAKKSVKKATKKKAAKKSSKAAPKKKAKKAASKKSGKMVISEAKRMEMVSIAAYYLAMKRDDHEGTELDDWVRAEKEIDEIIAAMND